MKNKIILVGLASIILFACNNNSEKSLIESSSVQVESADDINQREVIKTASLIMQVPNIENSIIELKSLVNQLEGNIYHYEIENNSYVFDSYHKNLDSIEELSKIEPKATISVRIPVAQADTFISYVLSTKGVLQHLILHDEDITEDIWEHQEHANTYSKSEKASNAKNAVKNIAFDNEVAKDAIKESAIAKKMKYRTKYLWFDISLNGEEKITSKSVFAIQNARTPMHISMARAFISGWHSFQVFIIFLIKIWPLYIISLIAFLVYKRNKTKIFPSLS